MSDKLTALIERLLLESADRRDMGEDILSELLSEAAEALKPRKPLTGEEMRDVLRSCKYDTSEALRVRWFYVEEFGRAVERAHWIKG